jgi:hypothetical protein
MSTERMDLMSLWKRCRAWLVMAGFLGPSAPEGTTDMREDLQVIWRNPSPPPPQKPILSKGEAGDRLAIYPSGRQVWFEDVSGGHALPDQQPPPRILPDDNQDQR